MSRLEAVVCYTVGEPGSGKTYRRCAVFLGDQFLPNTTGHVFTNYPIHLDAMAEHASAMSKGRQTPDQIRDRIHIIPQEVLTRWRLQVSGPWDFFKHFDTKGAIIAIDEIHNYCPAEGCKTQKQWEAWLGEVRHMGAQCEFLTQDPGKCHKLIERHTGIRRRIEKDEHRCDPLLKIPMKCWYELIASWTGTYEPKNWEVEQRRLMSKWVTRRNIRFRFDPQYYKLYDSFSAPIAGGGQAATGQVEYEFQRRSFLGMHWWFFWQSPGRFFLAFLVACFFAVALTGNGGVMMEWLVLRPMMAMGHNPKQPAKQPRQQAAAATPVVLTSSGPSVGGDQSAGQQQLATTQPVIPPELLEELDRLKQRNQRLESQLADASAVVLLERDSATFRDGYTVKIGEAVQYGDYKGAIVDRIDWRQRTVVLRDGRLLRMGRGLQWSDAPTADARGGDVQDTLPRAADDPPPKRRQHGGR